MNPVRPRSLWSKRSRSKSVLSNSIYFSLNTLWSWGRNSGITLLWGPAKGYQGLRTCFDIAWSEMHTSQTPARHSAVCALAVRLATVISYFRVGNWIWNGNERVGEFLLAALRIVLSPLCLALSHVPSCSKRVVWHERGFLVLRLELRWVVKQITDSTREHARDERGKLWCVGLV